MQDRIARSSDLLAWLKRWHSRGAYIAAICTGVAFLGECGLLDGRKATTHWALADILRERYPGARWQPEQFVTEDGRILCSGGVYASIDISLYLVEKFCGHEVALQCAKSLLLSMPRSRQSGYAVVPLARPHFDGKVREVEEYLHESFATEVSIDTLAERIGMSSRTFIRRFKAATGHMPGAYVQSLRVAAAKELLEQGGRSVQTIASKIGYDDIAFFRKVFKRHTGMTPTEYRDCFGSLAFRREEVAHVGPVVAASGQA